MSESMSVPSPSSSSLGNIESSTTSFRSASITPPSTLPPSLDRPQSVAPQLPEMLIALSGGGKSLETLTNFFPGIPTEQEMNRFPAEPSLSPAALFALLLTSPLLSLRSPPSSHQM